MPVSNNTSSDLATSALSPILRNYTPSTSYLIVIFIVVYHCYDCPRVIFIAFSVYYCYDCRCFYLLSLSLSLSLLSFSCLLPSLFMLVVVTGVCKINGGFAVVCYWKTNGIKTVNSNNNTVYFANTGIPLPGTTKWKNQQVRAITINNNNHKNSNNN